MAAVLAADSYSRIGFSIYFAVHARRVRVPGGSKFHLEPGTILFIIKQSYKDQSQNLITQFQYFYYHMHSFNIHLINKSN